MLYKLFLSFIFISLSLQLKAINAIVSNTVFYLPDSIRQDKWLPYIETSWEIIPHTLHYRTTSEHSIIAQIKTDIVYTKDKKVIVEDHFIIETPPGTNVNEIGSNKIIDLRRYFLTPGRINMSIKFTDINDTSNFYITEDTFTIEEPSKNVYYSKLQLLDTFFESNSQTVFSKNGFEQIPLNGCFLDNNKRTLHYYAELYQLKSITKNNYPLIQKVFISKKMLGAPYEIFTNIDTIIVQDVSLVSGSFNISSLLSGNYFLNATLENKNHNILTSNSLFFQRVNKHPSKEDSVRKFIVDTSLEHINVLDLNKTFISKFSVEQLMSILKMLLPVSDAAQTQIIKGFLDKPDITYIQYYIYNYFTAINPANPGKAWKEYSEKVIEVNKLYKSSGKPGYITDRGFYYLKYGMPTDVITVDNEPGTLPYEIWQYDVLTQNNQKTIANAIFLFYRPNSAADDYIMLHCTVGGEPQNNNWRSQLYLNGNSNSSGNKRVEQYLGNGR